MYTRMTLSVYPEHFSFYIFVRRTENIVFWPMGLNKFITFSPEIIFLFKGQCYEIFDTFLSQNTTSAPDSMNRQKSNKKCNFIFSKIVCLRGH